MNSIEWSNQSSTGNGAKIIYIYDLFNITILWDSTILENSAVKKVDMLTKGGCP